MFYSESYEKLTLSGEDEALTRGVLATFLTTNNRPSVNIDL